MEGRSCSRGGMPQCYQCKGYGHFTRECPSQDFYKIGPNGLPIWVREPSQNSSAERYKPEEKKPFHQGFNLGKGRPKSPGVTLRREKSLLNRTLKCRPV